ncbi:MAG: ATP synthase F1 subunit delta [Chloroflexi bacterium]|nr:ATP synthase F1 subunit delta [Chloroflexota bacterium]
MSAHKAAHTYAQALYELAFEEWLKELRAARKRLGQDPKEFVALDDSSTAFAERQAQLDKSLPDGISEKTRNFLYLLMSKQDLHLLDEVIRDFDNMVHGQKTARLTAQVTSAVALMGEEQEVLQATLQKRFGSDLQFDYNVDPAVLGGIRVRVGDHVIDGTVAKKLQALKEQLGISA